MACDRCREYRGRGATYCGACGEKLRSAAFEKVLHVSGLLILALVSVGLVAEVAVMFGMFDEVSAGLGGWHSELILVLPVPVPFARIEGAPLLAYYVLLVAAAACCVGLSMFKALKGAGNESPGEDVKRTALYETGALFAALLAVEMAYMLALALAGVDMGMPSDRPDWEFAYELLEASVWEEVATRALYIGVPLAALGLLRGSRSLRPVLGGGGLDRVSVALIFFSAAVFGAAHVESWGLWKFVPTFLFGLIAGYLYCRYGLYASITLHFLNDYLSSTAWMGGTGIETGLAMLALCVLGAPFAYAYARDGVRFLDGLRRSEP